MPRVTYGCELCCKVTKKTYKSSKDILKEIKCDCGGEMSRRLSSPSSKSKIIVDNGIQAKATELDRDIVEIIEDREEAGLRQRGDAILKELI
jgi:hypothetical protein